MLLQHPGTPSFHDSISALQWECVEDSNKNERKFKREYFMILLSANVLLSIKEDFEEEIEEGNY